MAIANQLPNGYIVLLLSPREATNIGDELLDPEAFPWQNTESERTAFEVRSILRNSLEGQGFRHLAAINSQLMSQIQEQEEGGDRPEEDD